MHGPLNVKLKKGKTNSLKLKTFGSQIFVFVLWSYNTYSATYPRNFKSTVSDLSSDRLNKFLHSYGGSCPAIVLRNFHSISLLLVFNIPRMFLIYIVEVLELLLFCIASVSVF